VELNLGAFSRPHVSENTNHLRRSVRLAEESKYAAGFVHRREEKPSATKVAATPREVRIISHSNIFYWWPAWVAGYAPARQAFLELAMRICQARLTRLDNKDVGKARQAPDQGITLVHGAS
jgi:hypothetical protein